MQTHALAPPASEHWALQSLRSQLQQALGTDVGVACRDVDGDPQDLWPVERAAIAHAIPRRQREFAAGRSAARDAVVKLGSPASAIPCAPDRSPVWPDGIVGSITHTRQTCVAIAGRRERVFAMGIDIEEDVPLDPSLWASICRRYS